MSPSKSPSFFLFIICTIFSQTSLNLANKEFFSAVVHLKHLLNTENDIVEKLNIYLNSEEKRLKNVRDLYIKYKDIDNIIQDDPDSFLTNPVNAFLLLKRLSSDWNVVKYLTNDAIKVNLFSNNNATFPTINDVEGAANALLRLQKVYKLDIAKLSNGIIPSTAVKNPDHIGNYRNHKSQKLTANDCFDLGVQAYNNGQYKETILWMEQAYKLTSRGYFHIKENIPDRLKIKILEYFAFSLYKEGFYHEALEKSHELLTLDPMHQLALNNVHIYQSISKINKPIFRDHEYNKQNDNIALYPGWHDKFTYSTYEALCRGEQIMSAWNLSRLTCFYLNTSKLEDKYFRLWKIPVEEANKYPHIVQFHDIIFEDEINLIKSLSEARLKRATVRNIKNDNAVESKIRISQSFFIPDSEHEVVKRLTRRIQGITGLTMETAEYLQVGNYGLGGHYEPHNDHSDDNNKNLFGAAGTGNRLATWMFYMSDVIAGGATVFPSVGATIWPRKGSAAFWYNLRASGNGDPLTRHAGCPVLVGTKWVANKWIHELDQHFRKPCHLKYDQFLVFEEGHH